jgi:hypothetical protein
MTDAAPDGADANMTDAAADGADANMTDAAADGTDAALEDVAPNDSADAVVGDATQDGPEDAGVFAMSEGGPDACTPITYPLPVPSACTAVCSNRPGFIGGCQDAGALSPMPGQAWIEYTGMCILDPHPVQTVFCGVIDLPPACASCFQCAETLNCDCLSRCDPSQVIPNGAYPCKEGTDVVLDQICL